MTLSGLSGLLLKFVQMIPFKRLTYILNDMLSNRMFKIFLNVKTSKRKCLSNSLTQSFVLAPILFNVYISDMPSTKSRKFGYANDLALLIDVTNFEEGEDILVDGLNILTHYYTSWCLKPNPDKTEVSVFHLNNKLANKRPCVKFNGVEFQYNNNPKYLRVFLDRTLSFKHHLTKTACKIRTRTKLIQILVGSDWGATIDSLRVSSI